MTHLIGERTPKIVITRHGKSYTGKYKYFFGHHFPEGKICYDVGTINQQNGEIISRHYHDGSYPNPKAEALMFYDQFAASLRKKPKNGEEKDNNAFISNEYRLQLKRTN